MAKYQELEDRPDRCASVNDVKRDIGKRNLILLLFVLFLSGGCEASVARTSSPEEDTDTDTALVTPPDSAGETDSETEDKKTINRCDAQAPVSPVTSCTEAGIAIQPPWNTDYTCVNLGPLPNVPPEWGGLTLHPDDNNILLIGGHSNEENGKLYSVGVTRDRDCHITGFSHAPTTAFSSAQYNDGGIAFGPNGVLFLARWPVNQLAQLLPGSAFEDKVIDLEPLNITSSPGGLGFVPKSFVDSGSPDSGSLKIVSWPSGDWFTLALAPDERGTFDIIDVKKDTTIPGGPEGFVYISRDNVGFDVDSLLVAEWSDDKIAAYESDGKGNPLPQTRKDFVVGLDGAEGAFIDPLSGDFLFITWGGAEVLIAVRGFRPPVL